MFRILRPVLCVLALALLMPAAALAQVGSIAGTVRDTQGGVLPGVTVEASSPKLIEKVRSTVTDGGGRYQIAGLPVGTYKVAFKLEKFSTFERRRSIEPLSKVSHQDPKFFLRNRWF